MTDPALRFNELAAEADARARYADDLESIEGPCRAGSAQRVRASKFIDMARAQIDRLDPAHRRYAEARLTMLHDRLGMPAPGGWRLDP